MPAHPTVTVTDLELSDEVRAFCQRNDLIGHLSRAVELARQCFEVVGDPVVRLEQDPEDGECYLDLEIRVRADEDMCALADRNYLRSWVDSTPWPAVHLIRPLFDILPA